MYAAIRYYSDEGGKIITVPTTDIENYDEEKCTNEPYYVKKYDNDGNHRLSPAEVLAAGSKEELCNQTRRFKKKKIRRSDALEQLIRTKKQKHQETNKNPKAIRMRLKELARQGNGQKCFKMIIEKRKTLILSSNSEEENKIEMAGPSGQCTESVEPVPKTDTGSPSSDDIGSVRRGAETPHSASRNEDSPKIITETPRRRRQKLFTVYRPKVEDPPTDSDEEYKNNLTADAREVDEERALYEVQDEEIFVGCNKCIQLSFWEYIKQRGPNIFLREMSEIYWSKRELINRCFKTSKITTEVEDRSPRKKFTPKKYKLLRRVYKDYLHEYYGKNSKARRVLRNMNKVLGYKIRDIRKTRYEKIN